MDAEYLRMLRRLAQATQVSAVEIDQNLSQWSGSNPIGVQPETVTPFLTQLYDVEQRIPQPTWKAEFNQLQNIAQTRFIFEPERVFINLEPRTAWTGSFKTIHRVRLANDPKKREYALSRIPDTPSEEDQENFEAAQNEMRVIELLQKAIQLEDKPPQGILHFYTASLSADFTHILFLSQFCNRGDAYSYTTDKTLQPTDQLALTTQLLEGLSFLHRHGFVHRDIKPGNIFLHRDPTHQLHAFLGDFGTAYQKDQPHLEEVLNAETHIKTTYLYLAPEVVEKFHLRSHRPDPNQLQIAWNTLKQSLGIRADFPYRWHPEWSHFESDRASDEWSLGVSLLEIVTGHQLNSRRWIHLKNHPKPVKTLKPEDFLLVEQRDIDSLLDLLNIPRYRTLLPVLRCLLRVQPEERCTAEEAARTLSAQKVLFKSS